jgi:hypothetical protein
VNLPNGTIKAVFASVQARLKNDDRMNANKGRYILSVGTDFWKNKTALWDKYLSNSDAGISRFKAIKSYWRTYYMTSAPRAIIHECIN